MTQKEQLADLKVLYPRYRDALRSVVSGQVEWRGAAMVCRIGGMPKRLTRVGMIDGGDPSIVVHELDPVSVIVVTPDQAAQWNWQAVDAFPNLDMFLRRHADTAAPVNTHVPSYAWLRKVQGN